MEPQLLLLDEPLSNLDAKLRERMRFELKRLQRELRITTVYVTHDQSEALALSHEIARDERGAHGAGRLAARRSTSGRPIRSSPISSARPISSTAPSSAGDPVGRRSRRKRDRVRHGAGNRAAARGERCRAHGASGRRRAVRNAGVGRQHVARDRRPEGVPRRSDRLSRAASANGCCWRARIRGCRRGSGTRSMLRSRRRKCSRCAPAMPEFLDTPARSC